VSRPAERSLPRLRRALLVVLLSDATATAALTVAAHRARARGRGPAFAAVAAVAAAGLAPGVLAVSREERAHRRASSGTHGMTASVVLFAAGLVINTVGTSAILAAPRRLSRAEAAADVALLLGGNGIGVPYLLLLSALHPPLAARTPGRA
jgi:hypothetical protein